MSKYAIFGDSFITRLQSFTNGKLDFDRPHRFFGVSEMSTQSKFTSKFREMLEYQPRQVNNNKKDNELHCLKTRSDIICNALLKTLFYHNTKSHEIERWIYN
jgi:hypothetical protein